MNKYLFYFSATGNSRWVAEQLAPLIGAECIDLTPFIREHTVPVVPPDAALVGLVFPIHSWALPLPVLQLVTQLSVPDTAYRFAVCTCGDDAGKALNCLHKRFPLNSAWSVAMPNTYVPMFNLDKEEVARNKFREAHTRIQAIATQINQRKAGWNVHEGMFPVLKTYVIRPFFERYVIQTKGFYVDDGCVQCGKCVKACPMGNIQIRDGKVSWGKECIHCMACVHICPHQLVQYTKSTRKKGRYRIQDYCG